MKEKYIKLFWEKVNIPTEKTMCWEWMGARNKKGYGVAWDGNKTQKAHRVAYMLENGEMPNKCVLHHCDNPGCVNPNHLFVGTRADNNKDMVQKNRHVPGGTHTPPFEAQYKRGVNHPSAKLTPERVRMIRSERKGKNTLYSKLAEKYKLSLGHVWRIVNKKVWTHVE